MPSTTTAETTREELIAEYVARDAIFLALNRVYGLLYGEDEDVLARFPDDNSESFVRDARLEELFLTLWPTEADSDKPEHQAAAADSLYLAGRVLRTVVYHGDSLRSQVQELFRLAETQRREAEEVDDA